MKMNKLQQEWDELEKAGLLDHEELTKEQENELYDEFLDEVENSQTKNSYVEAVCVGSPLSLPVFNEESDQWEVPFEESSTDYNPYATDADRDILFVSCESAEEACNIYNHYLLNPITEEEEEVEAK